MSRNIKFKNIRKQYLKNHHCPFFPDSRQMFGRHLGRRTFRKLNFVGGRDFVTVGQMFRMAKHSKSSTTNSDNLNSDEIRVRLGSNFERQVSISHTFSKKLDRFTNNTNF